MVPNSGNAGGGLFKGGGGVDKTKPHKHSRKMFAGLKMRETLTLGLCRLGKGSPKTGITSIGNLFAGVGNMVPNLMGQNIGHLHINLPDREYRTRMLSLRGI